MTRKRNYMGKTTPHGPQLVAILVEQLDGAIELIRDNGTEFRSTFRVR